MRDIVIPKGNEKELAKMAETLGYDTLWFIYSSEKESFKGKLPVKHENFILSEKRTGKQSCAKCTPDNIRNLVEHVKPEFIFGLEESMPKDYIHQRGSGINHIIAKLAAQNGTAIAFSLASLQKDRARIMGRMKQNIELCRKFKCRMLIGSFASSPLEMRAPGDIQSLFTLLGIQDPRNSMK